MKDTTTQPLLEVTDLRTHFATARGKLHAVDGVSFSANSGQVLCIVGESGSGKSVTLRSIMQLVQKPGKVTHGSAKFHGEDLLTMSRREIQDIRGDRISMIFQNPLTSLNPAMTIGAQVTESLLLHRNMSKAEAAAEGVELLRQVGIPSPRDRLSDYPAQFSGGMRQRIMIAAALSCKPEILIADEPTTALDVSMQAQILQLLKALQAEISNLLIMITHDLGVVASIADEVMVMYAGRVVEKAPVREIFANPCHPYTQGLINTVRALEDSTQPLSPIPGTPAIPLGERTGCAFAPRCAFARDDCRQVTPTLESLGPDHTIACHVKPQMGASDD
ncbi:ABC transporter ATP-binding protein [uncultured Roseovarius sp.]|uniref:ABC transporter ATP-binding protein n=1 Tax=uncultured Roseovarius sp. TaxID=293344 RepID=UPI00261D6B0F|nr:ABC transporter ATP-binding protein [uncultured Roseovarius sp.]